MDLYEHRLDAAVEVDDGDTRVAYHKACALRSDLLVLVNTFIFMDKV